jgi:putative holliday junction resolvase
MNILGIDYGKKRIGLAWVDTDLGVVLPYGVVEHKDTRNKVQETSDLILRETIDQVVVGLPIGLDGKENENTANVRRFVESLKEQVQLPIELVDERFTSKQADRMGGDASRDEKAAMVILQSYLGKTKS